MRRARRFTETHISPRRSTMPRGCRRVKFIASVSTIDNGRVEKDVESISNPTRAVEKFGSA